MKGKIFVIVYTYRMHGNKYFFKIGMSEKPDSYIDRKMLLYRQY